MYRAKYSIEVAWIEAPIRSGRRLPTRLFDFSKHRGRNHKSDKVSLLNKEADVKYCGHYFDNTVHSLDRCQVLRVCIGARSGTPYCGQKT
jgi:hypothetical protein